MTESEPSAPLPETVALGDYEAACRNLAAAIERAERAERGRDEFKGLAATAADWLQSTRRDLDQARAQLAKVRAGVREAICSVRVRVDGEALYYAANDGTMPLFDGDDPEVQLIADAVLALLDPVGATEDEAKP